MSEKKEDLMQKIVSLAKRRGFVYPGSEIYGGFAGTYDYGPLGTLLKNNVVETIRKEMSLLDDIYEIDSAIAMHPKVWVASGHVGGFSDPLVECRECHTRSRADKMLEEIGVAADEKMAESEIQTLLDQNADKIKCPKCGKKDFTPVKNFNLIVQSNMGDFSGVNESPVYLRPETAQGTYVNYKNVLDSMPVKVPFGLFQIGKSFRNEINPRKFVFRTREFTQIEIQHYVHPDHAEAIYEKWKQQRMAYYQNILGIPADKLRFKQHENLVFYAKDAWDIEYKFDFGWDEIEGLHWRSDYDLRQHQEHSGVKMEYIDQTQGERYIPHVIEAASGLDRVLFMLLDNAYHEDVINDESRTFLDIPAHLAPVKIAVSPLLRNKEELTKNAREIFSTLKKQFGSVMYDDNGNIGKRYRRQDEIGTPFCVVFDFDSLEDGCVTVRDRNSAAQERVAIKELVAYFKDKFAS